MKEKETVILINGKEYKLVFNLNVMQEIQNEYGTFAKWGKLTDGKTDADGNTDAVDVKALIFGIKAMLNEAIDIANETVEKPQPFFTEKQVGRIITDMGLQNATAKLNQTVIDSTKEDNPKNE